MGCHSPTTSSDSGMPPQGFAIPASQFVGLYFTATDARYTSSALYWMNFRTGTVESRLSGESGDPWVLWTSNRLFMANRSPLSNNAYFLAPETRRPTVQKATPGLNIQHGVSLGNGDILVSDWSSSALHQLHGKNLETVARYTPPGFAEAPKEPGGDLLRLSDGETFYILALSHGLEAGYRANDGQTLTIWKEEQAGKLQWVRSLPLSITTPHFLHPSAKGVWIMGLCAPFLAQQGCKAGRAWFSFEDQQLSNSVSFSSLFLQSYGALIGGNTPNEAFAFVVKPEQPDTRRLAHLTWKTESALTATVEIPVPLSSLGSPLLLFDPTSHILFIGNTETNGGSMTLWDTHLKKVQHRMELERIPYNGTLAL